MSKVITKHMSKVRKWQRETFQHENLNTLITIIVIQVTSSSVYLPLRHHGNDNNSRECCRHFMLNQCFFAAITW